MRTGYSSTTNGKQFGGATKHPRIVRHSTGFIIALLAISNAVSLPAAPPRRSAETGAPAAPRARRGTNRVDQSAGKAEAAAASEADSDRNAGLLQASQRKDAVSVQLWLDKGASAAATNLTGATPLMLAVLGVSAAGSDDAEQVVKLLLGRHAAVNARDPRGQTALFNACSARFSEAGGYLGNPRMVQILLENGADANARDHDGQTALLHDVRQRPIVSDAPLEIIRRLLAKRADPNAADKKGETPLIVAAARGRRDFAELLIAQGAALNLKNQEGQSALGAAIEAAEPEMTDLLLSKGADLKTTACSNRAEVSTALRNFALLRAAREGDREKVQALLDHGAPVNFRDRHGRTALMAAAESYSQRDETVAVLLGKGADLAAQDDQGDTALMLAAFRYNRRIVSQLLDKGAAVNARNKSGGTALLNAAAAGDDQTMSLLVQKGADVNARDDQGKTALILAAGSGMGGAILPLLLSKGADINAADQDGRTALMAAAPAALDENVHFLLDHGAKVNARAKDGSTAAKLVQAARTGPDVPRAFVEHLDEIIALLRKAGATD